MQAIAGAARGFAGVRFRHQGRCAATGMDCLGLVVAVARQLNLKSRVPPHPPLGELDRTDYGLLPDGAALKAVLDRHVWPIDPQDAGEGSLLLMRLDGNPQHLGIRTVLPDGRAGLIHAYRQAGKVVEHQFASPWVEAVVAAYRVSAF